MLLIVLPRPLRDEKWMLISVTVDPFPTIVLNLKFLQEGETMALIDVPVDIRQLVTLQKTRVDRKDVFLLWYVLIEELRSVGGEQCPLTGFGMLTCSSCQDRKKSQEYLWKKWPGANMLLKKAEQNKMCGQWKIMHDLIAHTRCKSCWLIWLFL